MGICSSSALEAPDSYIIWSESWPAHFLKLAQGKETPIPCHLFLRKKTDQLQEKQHLPKVYICGKFFIKILEKTIEEPRGRVVKPNSYKKRF